MDCFVLDSDGRVSGREKVTQPDNIKYISVREHPYPQNLQAPVWIDGTWKEGATKRQINEQREVRLKEYKLRDIKTAKEQCEHLIKILFPTIYHEFNLLRENPNDPRFKILDDLRAVSNDIEKKIEACESMEKLQEIDIRELFRKDERAQDENGKFIGDINDDTK